MKLSLLDRSNYYRGLLVLAGRDRIIDPRERALMLKLGRILDFERRFCEAAIDDFFRNRHITGDPVTFSSPETAASFLHDGIRLACVDGKLHAHELAWLKAVAQANGLKHEWVDLEIKRFLETKGRMDPLVVLSTQHH